MALFKKKKYIRINPNRESKFLQEEFLPNWTPETEIGGA